VKLFLDAHISGQNVGAPLRAHGHEVRAADDERKLDGLDDEELLSLATDEEQIFITFDVHDFPVIVRHWAEAGRSHAGCAIVLGIDHGEFGVIIDVITGALAARPQQADWTDLTLFIARVSSEGGG
jgi:hypothetical protein